MQKFRSTFLALLCVCSALADEAAPETVTRPTLFSLASARAEGRELTTVELLVDAYINLLDIMSKDDGAPTSYDEEDVLRQYAEYDNPYVADIIKAFEEKKPEAEGAQTVERLAKVLEDHFAAQGFLPDEHRSVLDRHELFGKVSTRLVPPKKQPSPQGQATPGHMGGEL